MRVLLGKHTKIEDGIRALARCGVGALLDIDGCVVYRDLIRQKLVGIKSAGAFPYPCRYDTVGWKGERIYLTDMPLVNTSVSISIPNVIQNIFKLLRVRHFDGYLYIVGGYIRDYFLGRKTTDIDIVVYGNWRNFIDILKKRYSIRVYPLGAKLDLGDYHLEFSFSRYDFYTRPGKMPIVVPASISADLERRDFTIGSLGYLIYPYNGLMDPFGGLCDLKRQTLRFIRGYAPFEDPSRVLRGLRYEGILGFHFDDESRKLARDALMERTPFIVSRRYFRELENLIKAVSWDSFREIDSQWYILKNLTGEFYDTILRHINNVDRYDTLKYLLLLVYVKKGLEAGSSILGFSKRERKIFVRCKDREDFINCIKEGL